MPARSARSLNAPHVLIAGSVAIAQIFARTAHAQSAAPPAAEAAPSVALAPTGSAKDGFYLRLASGPVLAGTSIVTAELSHPNYDLTGAGVSFDGLVGGSPLPGLATGGAVSFSSFALGNDAGNSNLLMLGAFVDVFPHRQSWHAGGLLGVASVRTSTASGRDEFAGGGIGAAAWLGYDAWLMRDWSLGGLLRLKGALARDPSVDRLVDSTDLRSSTWELALLLSALHY